MPLVINVLETGGGAVPRMKGFAMTTTSNENNRILVIGFGDKLSGENAVGRLVAEALIAKRRANVVTLSVTQLVPEFATLVASSRAVIFVDATAEQQQSIEVRELVPACPLSSRLHHVGPRELLAVTRNCYGHAPLAWLVAVPGHEFDVTDGLSATATLDVLSATEEVEQLIEQLTQYDASHA
jgi:hydrogenase maturation protease